MEEAEALQKVIDTDKIKQIDLAKAIGKAEFTVSEILKLNTLSDTIKKTARTDNRWTRKLLLRHSLTRKSSTRHFIKQKKALNKVNLYRRKKLLKKILLKCTEQS